MQPNIKRQARVQFATTLTDVIMHSIPPWHKFHTVKLLELTVLKLALKGVGLLCDCKDISFISFSNFLMWNFDLLENLLKNLSLSTVLGCQHLLAATQYMCIYADAKHCTGVLQKIIWVNVGLSISYHQDNCFICCANMCLQHKQTTVTETGLWSYFKSLFN